MTFAIRNKCPSDHPIGSPIHADDIMMMSLSSAHRPPYTVFTFLFIVLMFIVVPILAGHVIYVGREGMESYVRHHTDR